MAGSDTTDVDLTDVPAVPVGGPRAHLDRPGFWHGRIGVARCGSAAPAGWPARSSTPQPGAVRTRSATPPSARSRSPCTPVDAVHPHVHGANLGVRGSAYLDVGGFPPVAADEDRALVAALVRSGAVVLRTPAGPVLTSARRVARARAGLGRDMRLLAARVQAAAR